MRKGGEWWIGWGWIVPPTLSPIGKPFYLFISFSWNEKEMVFPILYYFTQLSTPHLSTKKKTGQGGGSARKARAFILFSKTI
jgi:hypothetical protein